jgi:hypothetical protein
MAAVLNPSLGEGMKESPVRPQLTNQGLESVRGSAVGSSFAASVPSIGTIGNQPVSSRVLGCKAGPYRLSSAESSRMAALLPQNFESKLVLHGESSRSAQAQHGIGLGISVPPPAPSTGFVPSGTGTPSPLRKPLGPPKQRQVRGTQPDMSSVLDQGNYLNDGQVCFIELLLERQLLTIELVDDFGFTCAGKAVLIGCAFLLRSNVHYC